MKKEQIVYLLTTGTGADGNEWQVLDIFKSEKIAKEAKTKYEYEAQIEKWLVKENSKEYDK